MFEIFSSRKCILFRIPIFYDFAIEQVIQWIFITVCFEMRVHCMMTFNGFFRSALDYQLIFRIQPSFGHFSSLWSPSLPCWKPIRVILTMMNKQLMNMRIFLRWINRDLRIQNKHFFKNCIFYIFFYIIF